MPQLTFALRHLHRHWRMNLMLLLGLTLATALLASLPSYAVAVATHELDQRLRDARSTERNLLITGSRYTFNSELLNQVQENLGQLLKEHLIVRRATLLSDPPAPAQQGETGRRGVSFLDVYAFDGLADRVHLLEGRLPAQVRVREAEPQRPPPVEAVIGARAAESTGYTLGDRLTATQGYHRLDIVGIVEPLVPRDDVWGDDFGAFDITTDARDPNAEAVTLPVIIAPASMRSNFKFVPIFQHEVLWRIILNHDIISADNAQAVHADLINLQTQLGARYGTVSTGLPNILADYLARLSLARTTLLLLIAQAFIFVLYTLAVLSSFLLDRSQIELATLSSRGASAWQITQAFAVQYLILALPAALLSGPALAQAALRLWAASSGDTVPAALPPESWLLSAVAAALAWLALVLPVYPAARRNPLDWQGIRARPPRRSVSQRLYLDLFLLVFAALLYWQLSQSGSFLTDINSDGTTRRVGDPLLLIGPSLLLIAVAMVFLRLYPFALGLVARVFQRRRGLALFLSMLRLARDPLKPGRVMLLIGLASGLALFANAFGDSLAHSQQEMAHYLAGAELRVALDHPTGLTGDQLADQPGVRVVSPVLRTTARTEQGQMVQFLAVEPTSFVQVAGYPTGLTNLKIPSILRAIQTHISSSPGSDDALPAVFSFSALPTNTQVGDLLFMNLARQRIPLRVQGSITNFPTLSGAFVIVSLSDLQARNDLEILGEGFSGTSEAWLTVDRAQRAHLTRRLAQSGRVLDSTQSQLQVLRSDALAQGTQGAFQLNTLTLAVFSVAAFALVQHSAAQRRVSEFGVLRAMGLSARQLLALLLTEAALVMTLGLAAGTVIGCGMARLMIPYLSQTLSEPLAGVTIKEILLDWPAIAQQYLVLIALYGLAMLLLLLVLLRADVHRTLRVGDE